MRPAVTRTDDHLDEDRKAALRRATSAARRELSSLERQAASGAIVRRLQRLPELRAADTVLLYAASREEADIGALVGPLVQRGVTTLFPRVRGDELELVAAADIRTLQLGYRGIHEPAGPAVDPEVVDVALLPGVAFDLTGGRLGQGGGHFDRLLRRLPPHTLRVGVAFACQVVPRVPQEDHDAEVDLVVTDRAAYRTPRRD